MAGAGRDKIRGYRDRGAAFTGSFQRRPTRAEDEAFDRLMTELEAKRQADPNAYEAARKKAQNHVVSIEATKSLNAETKNETYTPLTPEQEQQAVALETARNLNLITVTPIEGEAREEEEEEAAGPLEPIRIQIEQLPSAPALQPPPQLIDPLKTRIPQLNDQMQNLPTPGSLQYLVLAVLFFLAAIVPMLVWNGKGYTRLQLLWRAMFAGATLPESDWRKAQEAKEAAIEAGTPPFDVAVGEQVVGTLDTFWNVGQVAAAAAGAELHGIGAADGYGFGAAGDDLVPGAGPDYGSSAAAMLSGGGDPFAFPVGNPGGGWLYDDHGMLKLLQPPGAQNGAQRKKRGGS